VISPVAGAAVRADLRSLTTGNVGRPSRAPNPAYWWRSTVAKTKPLLRPSVTPAMAAWNRSRPPGTSESSGSGRYCPAHSAAVVHSSDT
jgi:hypothetical protein